MGDDAWISILLVCGASGVGKTELKSGVKRTLRFVHFDIDRTRGFLRNGFPSAWDDDLGAVDFEVLAAIARSGIVKQNRAGGIVTIPTKHVFARHQLDSARSVGIVPVILWGTEEQCLAARRKRNPEFSELDYRQKNRQTFETYGSADFAEFRIPAFLPDGSRPPLDVVMNAISQRLVLEEEKQIRG